MSASISTHTTHYNKVREELFNIRIKHIIEYIDWMTSLTHRVVGGGGGDMGLDKSQCVVSNMEWI